MVKNKRHNLNLALCQKRKTGTGLALFRILKGIVRMNSHSKFIFELSDSVSNIDIRSYA
eukprot:SAG31_NODE_3782_length_3884_cov_1.601057_1_plen_58_part_10